jgi:gliding motility-associated-like protein
LKIFNQVTLKKLYFLYFFLFVFAKLYAQKQTNIWQFGNGLGLDFKTSPPTAIYSNTTKVAEGSAAISDNNGMLLFYTNGQRIISRNGTEMKNGAGLLGDVSSTDNALIIPAPNSDSIYYIFTVGAAFQQNKGLRYSIVNINADGGNGEVITKNVLLEVDAYEKLAAVRHCNKKDVWIMAHRWNSGEYISFKVTASGVDVSPVVSNVGRVISGDQSNAIGSLKFSSNGLLLAAAHSYETNLVELMKFDNVTGQVSNPVYIKTTVAAAGQQNFTGVYGVEFSPNSNLLFVSENLSSDEPGKLFQFDITTHDSILISTTQYIVAAASAGTIGSLQLGVDGKIYVAAPGGAVIPAIENPNIAGVACNYSEKYITISNTNGAALQLGFPRFLQSFLNPSANPYSFSRNGNCTDATISFLLSRTDGIDSVKWFFGDGGTSTLLSPTHTYTLTGNYNVTAIVYKVDCSAQNDTIVKSIWIADSTNILGKDTGFCNFTNVSIVANIKDDLPLKNYLWNTGSTAKTALATAPGLYWVKVEQQGCTVADTINISVYPKPTIKASNDTTVCATKGAILSAVSSHPQSLLWSNGQNNNAIQIFKPDIYSVSATANGCTVFDTVIVVWGDCDFFIPNAFSPNGDGANENFGVLNNASLQNFSFKIFNRYGQVIYATENSGNKWDGTYKGKKMPTGNYTYQIIYINGQGYTKWLMGSVLLIR